jgi:Leucine-rich repeat (LRR) protein
LPEEIGHLYSLEQLYLEHNNLRKLPQSAVSLVNVRYFYLGKNLFSDFPLAICSMIKLQELDISYCGYIGLLPDCLRNIELLDLLILDSSMSLPFPQAVFHNPALRVIVN